MSALTQYDEENIRHTINGYYMRTRGESPVAAFERAKAEAITQLSSYVEKVKLATPESFFVKSREDSADTKL